MKLFFQRAGGWCESVEGLNEFLPGGDLSKHSEKNRRAVGVDGYGTTPVITFERIGLFRSKRVATREINLSSLMD